MKILTELKCIIIYTFKHRFPPSGRCFLDYLVPLSCQFRLLLCLLSETLSTLHCCENIDHIHSNAVDVRCLQSPTESPLYSHTVCNTQHVPTCLLQSLCMLGVDWVQTVHAMYSFLQRKKVKIRERKWSELMPQHCVPVSYYKCTTNCHRIMNNVFSLST